MARNIIAVIIGIVAAGVATYFVQSISNGLFPFPPELDTTDIEAMKEHVSNLPPLAFVIVMVAHFIGALCGALVACIVASTHQFRIALFIGVFMLAMGIINVLTIPHPAWFVIADIFMYLPGALLGYQLYLRFLPHHAAKNNIS